MEQAKMKTLKQMCMFGFGGVQFSNFRLSEQSICNIVTTRP